MELAKLTSKGQLTLPIAVRRKLGVREGDKVLFVEVGGRMVLMNATLEALHQAQAAFAGEAERAGLADEQDVVDLVKTIRHERGHRHAGDD